jgi:N-acetylglucosamine-6-phosphate deacetylase
MMSSITPAESIGLSGLRIGDLQPGYLADIVILSEDYGVVKTIVGGEVVYEK